MTEPELDSVDELERQLRRSTQIRRVAIWGTIVGALVLLLGDVAWKWHSVNKANDESDARAKARRDEAEAFANRPLTPAESARLDELARHLPDDTVAILAAWRAATAPGALAAITPGSSECAMRIVPPTLEAAESYVQYGSVDANYFGTIPPKLFGNGGVAIYAAGAPLSGTWLDDKITAAAAIATRVEAGTHARKDLEAAERIVGGEPYLFVVATEHAQPFVTATSGTYEAGTIAGTVYAFDPKQRAVICAGLVNVTNRSSIDVTYRSIGGTPNEMQGNSVGTAMLERDLEVQLDRAVAMALRAAETHAVRDIQ